MLVLLASCSPKIADVASRECLLREVQVGGGVSKVVPFTLTEENAGRLNAWMRANRSRFSTCYVTFVPHRSVLVGAELELRINGKLLIVNQFASGASAALQKQYVMDLRPEDDDILKLLRLKD